MELLAPVGDMECLKVAVANGANAVYLGMDGFNARAGAKNFGNEELRNAVEYAHIFGVKVYVTTNTLIKSEEMDRVLSKIDYAVQCHVDAFLVQDLGLAMLMKKRYPDIELHASTQMGIHNLEGAKVLENIGFKRVVLSREVSIRDIEAIRQNTALEIEMFVQGALCVAFSGNCYMSSYFDGSSGNRGRCKQLCRREYVVNGEKKYFLSTSDISLVRHIEELENMGVDSLKIEGRMRRPAYVAQAVKTYRDAMDKKGNIEENLDLLSKIYSRGEYNTAYLYGKDVMNIASNNHLGYKVGTVTKVEKFKQNLHKIYISSDEPIRKGDALKFMVKGKEVASMGVGNVDCIGNSFVVYSIADVPRNAEVNKIVDANLDCSLVYSKKLPISMSFEGHIGALPKLSIKCGDIQTTVFGSNELEKAKTSPVSKEELQKNVQKLEDTEFELEYFEAEIDQVFVAKSVINELRRNAVKEFKNILIYREDLKKSDECVELVRPKSMDYYIIRSASDVARVDGNVVYEPSRYNLQDIEKMYQKLSEKHAKMYLYLPVMAKYEDMALLHVIIGKMPKDIGLVANNYWGLDFVGQREVIAGTNMNAINEYTASQLMLLGCSDVWCSIEANQSDVNKICGSEYSYGSPTLMYMAHCPNQVIRNELCDTCRYKNTPFIYENGKDKYSVIRVTVANCYYELKNTEKVDIRHLVKNGKIIDYTSEVGSPRSTYGWWNKNI